MEYLVLCYLLRDSARGTEVCLAPKRRGHVSGKLNAAGGHVESEEMFGAAAVRETAQEQDVTVEPADLEHLGSVAFIFEDNSKEPLSCELYATRRWQGEPRATDELGDPEWFLISRLPLDRLPESDAVWLYLALTGRLAVATVWQTKDYQLTAANVSLKPNPSQT